MIDNSKTKQPNSLPINLEGLYEYCTGKEQLVQKLLSSFVQVGPEYQKELCDAIEKDDAEAIRGHCHKVRGAGAVIQAEPLMEIVAQIRQCSIDEGCDQVKSFLPALKKAFADIYDFIQKQNFPDGVE